MSGIGTTDRAIVIGGGIVGLVACFELSELGIPVSLIDPAPASGATHHAGGMLAPIAEVQYRQEALFPLMLRSAALSADLVQRVGAATPLPTGYRDDGTLVVAADRADADHLRRLADYQRAHGMTVDRLTVREARRLEGALAPGLAAAVSIAGDHQLAPRRFAAALIDALERRGTEFIRERAVSLDGGDPCRSIRCESGAIDASGATVVLANGMGAADVTGWYRGAHPLRLRPVAGDIMTLRVPERLRPLTTRVIRAFVEDRPVYLIPRDDRTVVLGATSREDDGRLPRAGSLYDLLRDGIRVVPGLEECELLEATVGVRPGTPDDLPYLGRAGSNLVVSTGYFRHGVLLAALGGRVVSDAVSGSGTAADLDISACDPWRHAERSAPSGTQQAPDPHQHDSRGTDACTTP